MTAKNGYQMVRKKSLLVSTVQNKSLSTVVNFNISVKHRLEKRSNQIIEQLLKLQIKMKEKQRQYQHQQ